MEFYNGPFLKTPRKVIVFYLQITNRHFTVIHMLLTTKLSNHNVIDMVSITVVLNRSTPFNTAS